MRTKWIFCFAFVTSVLFTALPKAFAGMACAETTLVKALIRVESEGRGGDYALGDTDLEDHAYGCLQIRQPCVDDVNRVYGTHFQAKDCLGNRELSIWIFNHYMAIYATKARLGHKPTNQDKARIWNGGPQGYCNKSTLCYWNRVKSKLK